MRSLFIVNLGRDDNLVNRDNMPFESPMSRMKSGNDNRLKQYGAQCCYI